MIRVGIIGAAGLSGLELIRILHRHPQVELSLLTSDRYTGRAVAEVFPRLEGFSGQFVPNDQHAADCELLFLAIPNAASLTRAPQLLAEGRKVIDLSGVFRLQNTDVFAEHYGMKHTCPQLLADAVYGLPEAYRARLPGASLVANPGCYPTAALLGLLPLGDLHQRLLAPPIIDAKSGVSGAGGRVEDDSTTFMSVQENFRPYKLFAHQHTPEIEAVLDEKTPYRSATQGAVVFTPHLLPVTRGILSSLYLRFDAPVAAGLVRQRFQDFADTEPCVTLLPEGAACDLQMVQGTQRCAISLHHDRSGQQWTICTAIDNLIKGAAGQAVQNLNLVFGWEETLALDL